MVEVDAVLTDSKKQTCLASSSIKRRRPSETSSCSAPPTQTAVHPKRSAQKASHTCLFSRSLQRGPSISFRKTHQLQVFSFKAIISMGAGRGPRSKRTAPFKRALADKVPVSDPWGLGSGSRVRIPDPDRRLP